MSFSPSSAIVLKLTAVGNFIVGLLWLAIGIRTSLSSSIFFGLLASVVGALFLLAPLRRSVGFVQSAAIVHSLTAIAILVVIHLPSPEAPLRLSAIALISAYVTVVIVVALAAGSVLTARTYRSRRNGT